MIYIGERYWKPLLLVAQLAVLHRAAASAGTSPVASLTIEEITGERSWVHGRGR